MAYYQSAAMEVDGEFLSCVHPPGSALCLPPPSRGHGLECNKKVSEMQLESSVMKLASSQAPGDG